MIRFNTINFFIAVVIGLGSVSTSQAATQQCRKSIAPSAPANLRVLSKTSNSVLVQWEPASGNGIVSYIVKQNGVFIKTALASAILKNNFINLKPSTGYTFSVAAKNNCNQIGAAATVSTTTSALIAPAPAPAPVAAPTPAPAPLTFATVSASALPSTLVAGQTTTINVQLKASAAATNTIVDLELINSGDQKINQRVFLAQNFVAGETKSYAWTYAVPATLPPGKYCVVAAVFSSLWANVLSWNHCSTQVTVTAPVQAPAPAPVAAPTPAPAPLSFATVSASAQPSSIVAGQTTTINVQLKASAAATNTIVDLEFINSGNQKIDQRVFAGQSFVAGETKSYAWTYAVPANLPAGKYCVVAAVFSSLWANVLSWNHCSTQVTVTAPVQAPAPAPVAAPTPAPAPAPAPAPSPTAISGVPTINQVGYLGAISSLKPASQLALNPSVSLQGTVFQVRQAGTVIDGFDLRGYGIVVSADNVTIRNCIINGGGSYWAIANGNNGLLVENVTFDGETAQNITGDMIASTGYAIIRRNRFVKPRGDAMKVTGGIVEQNFIQGAGYAPGAHGDGIQMSKSTHPLIIRNNFFDLRIQPGMTVTSALWLDGFAGPIDSVRVEGNVLLGGGYTVGLGPGTNMTFINNRLGGGAYGYAYKLMQPTIQYGNTDYFTGAPITLN